MLERGQSCFQIAGRRYLPFRTAGLSSVWRGKKSSHPLSSSKRWPKDNLFCITLLLSISALIKMIHSWAFCVLFCFVLLLCYPSCWWKTGWRRDYSASSCVWQKPAYLLYPKSPVQLSVLLPPLAHQTSLTFRASFPFQGGKDGKGQRELLPPQPHAGRQLHPTALSCCMVSPGLALLPEVLWKGIVVAQPSCSKMMGPCWCCAPASRHLHPLPWKPSHFLTWRKGQLVL